MPPEGFLAHQAKFVRLIARIGLELDPVHRFTFVN
jgi:hypothetical protein